MQTFKVGDWVVNSINEKIIKATEDFNPNTDAIWWKKWQPKEGELVILKDKDGIISVIKYNGEPNVYPFIGEITWLHKKD